MSDLVTVSYESVELTSDDTTFITNFTELDLVKEVYYNRRPVFDTIDRWTTPVWYVLGIPGNILAFTVWIQRRLRHSSGCYLAALAFDECVFLILQLLFELQFKWNITLLQLPTICEIFPVLFLTSQHLSPIFVLSFTVERYISVCHPFHRDRYCTTRRAVMIICGNVSVSLLVNSVQGYFWTFDPSEQTCDLRAEVKISGSLSLWSIWSWVTETIVFLLIPIAILVFNICVILVTCRLTSATKKMTNPVKVRTKEDKQRFGNARRPLANTVMLLVISFVLIITTLPVTILYVLYLNFEEGDPNLVGQEKLNDTQWQRNFVYTEVRTVVEEIGISHYALNFYIYFLTGNLFRKEFWRLVGRMTKYRGSTLSNSRTYSGSYLYREGSSFTKLRITNNREKNL